MILIFFLLCFSLSHANEVCVSHYSNKFTKNFSSNSAKVQVFRNQGFLFKILKLSDLKEQDHDYKIAKQYLDEFYPSVLQKGADFKDKIKQSNEHLWSQMHLLLVFDNNTQQKPIAGSAFITARYPHEKLGFEDELGLNLQRVLEKDFEPSTEVGRLSVDPAAFNKRKVLDAMLDTLYLMHQATTEIEKIYIYTSRKLHQLYAIKGLNFEEIPKLSSTSYIHENEIIAVFRGKNK